MATRLIVVVIYTDRAGEFRWRGEARNGRILADSGEGYTRKAAAVKAAIRYHGSAVHKVLDATASSTQPTLIQLLAK